MSDDKRAKQLAVDAARLAVIERGHAARRTSIQPDGPWIAPRRIAPRNVEPSAAQPERDDPFLAGFVRRFF